MSAEIIDLGAVREERSRKAIVRAVLSILAVLVISEAASWIA